MNSKERVLAALNNEIPDRVPLDIGSINNSGMHWTIEKKIKQHLKLKDNGYMIKSRPQLITVPDQSIIDYFDVDTCSVYMNESHEWIDNKDGTFTDMWGIGQKLNPDGNYYNMCSHPLENIEEIADLDKWQFPEPTEYMLEGLSEHLDANKDKCCVLEGFREAMFGLPSWLRRSENWYVDIMINEDFADALHEKLLLGYKKWIDFVMTRIGDRIDIVKFGDDMGAQNALLMSPEVYRARIKPYQADLYGYVKNKYKKPILLHSCGAIRPIIGDLIEIGVDALNPIQISAEDMEPESLKREFGNRIAFWGGGIDTQQVLGVASPDEIRAHVKHNISVFKRGGGYIFTTVHNIQPNVPIENILAMYEAYNEVAHY
ncbi:MAG: uroporphyrinogen decarboxylase family protein [Saccharofermentanales bacterium]|jgi:uroporphyrinogen decarboxylase